MTPLLHLRCWNHSTREAAVVCPECRRNFCRECATEHDGRMLCTSCVAAATAQAKRSGPRLPVWMGMALVGLLLAWLVFYNLGVMLARIPAEFHGGSR